MTAEVAPGIHRIESILGPRPFAQYLLRGERSLLVDTGVRETPAEVIAPFLESVGLPAEELDFVVISHADVDHFGGNDAVRQLAPRALFCAHAADTPWIEDVDRIMRERYGWYAEHGVGYEPDVVQWLRDAMGEPVPIDVRLRGGEVLRLGENLVVQVLHLPGHSPGHLGLWEPSSRTAIVIDAVMARGLLDTDGNVIHPSPYLDIIGYETSARTLLSLAPDRLLTAHYDVIEGAAVERFLLDTLEFVAEARQVLAELLEAEAELTLAQALAGADERLGPFTSMPNELAGPVRAHLRELVATGRATEAPDGKSWRSVS